MLSLFDAVVIAVIAVCIMLGSGFQDKELSDCIQSTYQECMKKDSSGTCDKMVKDLCVLINKP